MGKPKIISADNEIINALYENGVFYKEFEGITLFRTSAHEFNKNAVVERMIRTLKGNANDATALY
jgi:predicted DNA-binding antitoxin AbrB/MazE fold protein